MSPFVSSFLAASTDVVGLIGPSSSATAAAVAPELSEAGLVIISPTNTSPRLTSDLAGNAGEHNQPGYFRTAHNDLHQGAALSSFLHESFGPQSAAVVHQGDAYTLGLAQAFRNAYESRGGIIGDFIQLDVETHEVARPDQVADALAQIAPGEPGALFFPLYRESAEVFLQELRKHGGFENVILVAGDTALYEPLLGRQITRGLFVAGPDTDHRGNVNQATGKSAEDVIERFVEATGMHPIRAFWAHAYDATTLLLSAIERSSRVVDGELVINREQVRTHLYQVAGFQGLTGPLSCDEFGDCGAGRIAIIQNPDPENVEASLNNVVYRYPLQ